jgi:TRAP-type C4-dicarboxylate transport system substrate-binding protein
MWDVAQKYGDEMKSVKLLGITTIAGAQYIGKKATHVPADIAGQKMRNGGKIEAWMLESMGAEPIDIELGDLGTSLERGVADGAFLSWSLTFISGATRYTEYRTHLDLMYRTWLIAMNQKVWDSMPPNIQDEVMSVSGQKGSVIGAIANEKATNESMVTLQAADKKLGHPAIYEPTAAEMALWKEAVKPIWQKWAEELKKTKSIYADQGQTILDFVQTDMAKYSTYYQDYSADAQKWLDSRPKSQQL